MPVMYAHNHKQSPLERSATSANEAVASPHAVQLKQSLRGLGFAEQEAALRPAAEAAPVQRRESKEATTGLKANAVSGELVSIRQIAAAYAASEQRASTMYETVDANVRKSIHRIAGYQSTVDALTSKGELWEGKAGIAQTFLQWILKKPV